MHGFQSLKARLHSEVSRSGIQFFLTIFHFVIPVAATVDFMVPRIGPIMPFLLLAKYLEPIRDPIK